MHNNKREQMNHNTDNHIWEKSTDQSAEKCNRRPARFMAHRQIAGQSFMKS